MPNRTRRTISTTRTKKKNRTTRKGSKNRPHRTNGNIEQIEQLARIE